MGREAQAGVFEQVLVDRAFQGDGHQLVHPCPGDRISLETDGDLRTGPHVQVEPHLQPVGARDGGVGEARRIEPAGPDLALVQRTSMLPMRAAGPGSTSMTSRPSGVGGRAAASSTLVGRHPASQLAVGRGPPPPRRRGRGVEHLHPARAAERHQVVAQADALRHGGGAGPNVDELAEAEQMGEAFADLPHRQGLGRDGSR